MTFGGTRNRQDRVAAAALSLAIAVFAAVCSSGHPSAALWDDLAIASGLRATIPTCHTFWLAIASACLRWLPADVGFAVLGLAGPLTLGLLAYLFGSALQMMMPAFLRGQLAEARSHRLVRNFLILPMTAVFAMSEPIWCIGHFFTPDTLHILLGFVGFYGVLRFRRVHRRRYAIVAYLAMGLLCVEEPLGFAEIFCATCVLGFDALAIQKSGDVQARTKLTLYALLQRLLTVLSVVIFVAGLFAVGTYFVENGGLAAGVANGHEAIFAFIRVYFEGFVNAATPGGWVYFLGFGVTPLIISWCLYRKTADIERIVHFGHALWYIVIGLVAYLQLSNFRFFWIWHRDSGAHMVSSEFMMSSVMAMSAFTLAGSLMVLMVEVFYRHYERIAGALFHDAPDDLVVQLDKGRKRGLLILAWSVSNALPYVLVALSLFWCPKLTERGMYACVRDFIRLAADDCRGSALAITDGAADAALEFEMFRRGATGFKALSLLADGSPREAYLRRRGEEKDGEDWTALGISTMTALREWVRSGSPRATNLTVQIGFELWRNEKLAHPMMGATAGRTDVYDAAVRSNLVERAHALGARMLTLTDEGAPFVTSDIRLRELWNLALWRLARSARLRADEYDDAGDGARAQAETAFADALDDVNPGYQNVRRRLEWVPRQIQNRFAPREGLRFALARADFTLASTYARQVLALDENDFHAHFAMGMYYVTGAQYTRALIHLERAHRARPSDPVALNNLATAEMYVGRLDRAREHAEAALKLAPDVKEIRRTVQRVRHEIEKAEKTSGEGGVPK